MDDARAVLDRLERIEALERDGASAGLLLEQVRTLLREAEVWARKEPGGARAALAALDRCRSALEAGGEAAIH